MFWIYPEEISCRYMDYMAYVPAPSPQKKKSLKKSTLKTFVTFFQKKKKNFSVFWDDR